MRINCLSVSSAVNTAFASIGGTVLHSDDPDLPKLQDVIFAASDGTFLFGSDTITPLFPLAMAGLDCHDTEPLTILPVEEGNIKIQP